MVYDHFNEPDEPRTSSDYWAGRFLSGGNSNRNYNDSRNFNFNNYINIAGTNATPREIGDAVNAAQTQEANPFTDPIGFPQYELGG